MTFRVITGNTYQSKPKVEGADKLNELATRQIQPTANSQSPMVQPLAAAPVGQLLDRLEALSFTFEALNASSRTYAAEAVLETLARMERRDLQALAAVEAFASALKTVSQHLAGLRNAVQATAHETAIGMDHIDERLTRLEQKTGFAAGAEAGAMLDSIAHRLGGIEALLAEPAPAVEKSDTGAMAEALEKIARRVSRIEKQLAAPAAPAVDTAPITAALDTIGERLSRIENRLDEPAMAPVIELDATPLDDALGTIAQRIADLEHKVESGVDGLLAISQRLSHIETGLGMSTTTAIPDPAPATVAPPQPAMAVAETAAAPARQPATADEAAGAGQRVDVLLEQVFRVLSR